MRQNPLFNAWLWCVAAVSISTAQPLWGAVASRIPDSAKKTPLTDKDGRAEAKLVNVYRLIGRSSHHEALEAAEALVRDYPHFQLAQLIYGDLLAAHNRPVSLTAESAGTLPAEAFKKLNELREESRLRLLALKERPPPHAIPFEFLALSKRNRHAIAVDVSKSRLYLFENVGSGPRLLADYYVSVGKAGVQKSVEGDQRTPLGIYFITSNLDPRSLKDLYGSGALPINYPNALDIRRGKSGSGIWLHGTPSTQFSRAPLATDGCIAVANPDLDRIIRTVDIKTTPVVIAQTLKWTEHGLRITERQKTEALVQAWSIAKAGGDYRSMMAFYAADFTADARTIKAHSVLRQSSSGNLPKRDAKVKDISMLVWKDEAEIMIATFTEVYSAGKDERMIRQYWERRKGIWKIIYEAVLS